MGMQSETAVEFALQPIFIALHAEIALAGDDEEKRAALLRIAAVALQQFEWARPAWAEEFAEKWGLPR